MVRRLTISLSGLLLLAVTACSGSDRPAGRDTHARGAKAQDGRPAKEGWFGAADGLHARLEIDGVERFPGKAVLHLAVTSLESGPTDAPGAFGTSPADRNVFRVPLLDPVGRALYRPVAASPEPGGYRPGVARRITLDYPPLPASVTRITVITPGTAGEFTGVPVTDGTGQGGAAAPVSGDDPVDLYDITEGPVKEVVSSGADERIGLRTDVLFAFDSAKLTGRAGAVLDDAAAQIRRQAPRGGAPIRIEGYTDSKGDAAYNLALSRRRAESVRAEIQRRLGGAYRFSASGKGESDPIAKEGGPGDAAARSRNRRVEISYQVDRHTPAATATATAPATGRGGVVAPAAFRPGDGTTVASRFGRFGAAKRRLDVKPFYRDGAYLVAVFDIVDLGPGTTPPAAAYGHQDYPGGVFTAFSVIDPADQDVYRAVRIGRGPGAYVDPGWAAFRTGIGAPVRGFCYVPAPPDGTRSVTFDGGPFGKVANVPVV